MMGFVILISVLASTIPVGFFKPAPLDDITINLNLDESPKGQRYGNGGHHWGQEEDVDAITSPEECTKENPCGKGAICLNDDECMGDLKCDPYGCGVIQANCCNNPSEQKLEIKRYKGACSFTKWSICGLKYANVVTKCLLNPGKIEECVQDVIGDDSCIDCLCDLIHMVSADISCSGAEEENADARVKQDIPVEGEDTDASTDQGGNGHCVGIKRISCLEVLGDVEVMKTNLIGCLLSLLPIEFCLKGLQGYSYCNDCMCDILEYVDFPKSSMIPSISECFNVTTVDPSIMDPNACPGKICPPGTKCKGGCCPHKNWYCCPDGCGCALEKFFCPLDTAGKECLSHKDCPEACYVNRESPICGSWLGWKDEYFPPGIDCSSDVDCDPEMCYVMRKIPTCGPRLGWMDEYFQTGKPCSSHEDCPEVCYTSRNPKTCGPALK